jgi:hypothetical protein
MLVAVSAPAIAATCPDSPPLDLRGTRGAILNPNGAPVNSGHIKLYAARQISPNNQGAFDLSSVEAGVYFMTLTQKGSAARTVLIRLPQKASVMMPKQKEVWLKLSPDECVGMMVYVPNQ